MESGSLVSTIASIIFLLLMMAFVAGCAWVFHRIITADDRRLAAQQRMIERAISRSGVVPTVLGRTNTPNSPPVAPFSSDQNLIIWIQSLTQRVYNLEQELEKLKKHM